MITDTISYRKEKNFYRPDILQLLIEAKDGKLKYEADHTPDEAGFATIEESDIGKREVKREWNDVDITSQCLIFFLAGYETVSTLMNFASYELAIDNEIQDRLYQEIKEAKDKLGGRPVSYDVVMNLAYLDAFICECLRKHPGQPGFDRVCNEDTVIGDGKGNTFKIPKGMVIFINMFGMHYNPKYFPNPNKFDPERFLGENKKNIKPYTYMPFAVGPRACIGKCLSVSTNETLINLHTSIGSRFALMQVKLMLYYVVSNFEIGIGPKMCIPFRYKKGFKIEPEGCIVNLIKRRA